MTRRTEQISLHLNAYLTAHSSPPDAVLRELANETADLFPNETGLAIAPEQGTLMTLLTQITGAVSAIEIGTFTGYSSICVARGLAAGGQLLCCDISEEWTAIARRYWKMARVEKKIDLRLAPALRTLDGLLSKEKNKFDFAFIDADKANYRNYFERCLKLVRKGGLIALDNTLWGGQVLNPAAEDEDTRALQAFNRKLQADRRVEVALLTVGDGLTLALKR